jgi:DGQHR domain-containing protein
MPQFMIPCLIFRQRESTNAPKFALFGAPASEVLQWAAIKRREDDPQRPQRRLSRAKINAIKRFFQLDERNTIPPTVTVTLQIEDQAITRVNPQRPDLESMNMLTFEVADDVADADKPGLVIDGQHRLIGMSEFDPNCKVSVVALLNVDDMEKAFQFLVINNKVTRVPTDLIRTLALDYQENELAERLKTARLTLNENLRYVGIMDSDEASPFRGHIALVTSEGDERQRFVAPAAIENSIAVIQKKNVKELESDDALCEFFYGIWIPIKKKWPDLWAADSKLMYKISIVAMTTYMTEGLVAKYDWDDLDITDPEKIRADAQRLLSSQKPEFWRCEWTIRVSDTKVVQDKIVEALTRISRNVRADQPWHEDVDIVTL